MTEETAEATSDSDSDPQFKWLNWARRLQAISQAGISFASDPMDLERFRTVRDIAAEMAAQHTDLGFEKLLDLFSRDSGLVTPKVAVRAAIFEGDAILLVKENRHGRWTMPGGLVEINEIPSDAVAREVLEESGYVVKPTRLLGVYNSQSRRFHNYYTLFFDCIPTGETHEVADLETSEADYFPIDSLPPLAVENGRTQIKRLMDIHQNPDLPADFE
ncbi:MAG: NUDIX hydrolase N-terminal domain-containing protein [Actinomycetota bacterium]